MAGAKADEFKSVISSQDVEGEAVYNTEGKKLGTVDHLVIERVSGRICSVVITGSGFLGLGHAHCQVPWAALKYNPKRNGFEIQKAAEPV